MAESPAFLAKKRYAVVTGGNKGIGLETCRQLASQEVFVILTARDENRGLEAVENLKNSGINPDNVVFHQLDVTDSDSIASLADFINAKFGKLDILVNNAGIIGANLNRHAIPTGSGPQGAEVNFKEITKETYELAEECIRTNYYGPKTVIQILCPLLELSDSPRIVNVSSSTGTLKNIPSERIRKILGDVDNLTEEKIDEILNEFLRNFKDGTFVSKGWPPNFFSAYLVSKAALNALTRILAKKYPSVIINAICPGFVKTDINGHMGVLSVEEGGESPTKLALMPPGSPSGLFYVRFDVSSFEE